MRRLLIVAVSAALSAPASALAADPILALRDVQPGARCSGLTVVRGTAISSFDVEVLDVLDRQRPEAARILVRVSGPAVAATGLGPGFSGSPIYCTGADGVRRNVGAISETIGDYGGFVALATPIETILSQPLVPAPARSRAAARAHTPGGPRAATRSLRGPLTLSGVRPRLGAALARAARKAGRTLIASPATTHAAFSPQPLVPGAALAVGLTSGDVALGAAGTVAYADGPNVWALGHELEGAGPRALFLQDAYVHTVVNNPVNAPDLSTYKLASPGNDLGTITGDGPAGVTGILGGRPPSYPLRVTARDLDSKRIRSLLIGVADEGDVGRPSGLSPLGLVAAGGLLQAVTAVQAGAPARQSGDMCMTVRLRELKRPLRFCNTYTVDGEAPFAIGGALVEDITAAADLLDSFRFGVLHPTAVEIGVRVRHGVRQAFIVGGRVLGKALRGRRMTLALRLRHVGSGRRSTRRIRVRVPGDATLGRGTLRISGTPGDVGGDLYEGGALSALFEEEPDEEQDGPGPQSPEELSARFDELARRDGVTVTFPGPSPVSYRDPQLRISGSAAVRVRVRRGGR